MTGKRGKNHHLPKRVYFHKGWHFYVDQESHWHKLGRQWDRISKQRWIELSAGQGAAGTVAKLLDDFLVHCEAQVRAEKRSPATHDGNLFEAEELKLVLGRSPAHFVTKRHVASYLQKRSSKVRANREIAFLSSAYSWALSRDEWPLIEANPCYGVRRNREDARDNYVESAALVKFGKTRCPPWLRCYLVLKRICGLRQSDMLQLMKPASGEGWVKAFVRKGRKPAKMKRTWGVDQVLKALERDHRERELTTVFLFPNSKTGGQLTTRGFKSAWSRAMKGPDGTKDDVWTGAPFTEHDVRRKAGSDSTSLDKAQQMLAHDSPTTTQRHYRAGVVKIKPRR